MKTITEVSDSSTKQAYTQPALVELGDLKNETLTVAVAVVGDTASP